MNIVRNFALTCVLILIVTGKLLAQGPEVPKTWVDKDTGHRVYRLTDEPNSSAFYFNVNAYSPDERFMVYTAPDGIHTLELATRKTRLLVSNPPAAANLDSKESHFRYGNHAIVAGHKTDSIFFSRIDPTTHLAVLYKADLTSGETTKLATLPPRASVATVNADETLAAGVYEETSTPPDTVAEGQRRTAEQHGPLVQPESKGAMMERRLAARIPVVLFTIDLQTGKVHELLHSTDWIGHLLFSPIDPTLLMYCHEGPWQKVNRIWTIRTDGTQNRLMHQRTMLMEIAGHEFWGIDGETIWYDWQIPKGEDFLLAGIHLKPGNDHEQVAYHMPRNDWSIHFNVNKDASLFCGDGGDPGQVARATDGEWIELFHPAWRKNDGGIDSPQFVQPGMFQAEHLVNMKHHNYRLEPNVRFTPDGKMVIFTSNMFGQSYVFGVDLEKASPGASDVYSTPDLGLRFGANPPPTH